MRVKISGKHQQALIEAQSERQQTSHIEPESLAYRFAAGETIGRAPIAEASCGRQSACRSSTCD
jgi:hypothetical protein